MSGSFSTFLSEIAGVSKITFKSLSELKRRVSYFGFSLCCGALAVMSSRGKCEKNVVIYSNFN